ncbi:MAG: aspartyl protease family protein [Planctomycetes bacterium]|nr:aspartyl protease family protein [Planctomycetota bacterium]
MRLHCRFRVLVLVVVATIAAHRSPLPAQATAAGALHFTTGDHAELPIELAGDLVLVQARINGGEPAWLLFDTGATINVLDDEFARRMELGLSNLPGTAGERIVARGLTVSLAEAELTDQTAYVLPLTDLMLFVGRRFVGIFGYELLRHAVVDLDYAGGTLGIHAPGTFAYSGEGQRIPLAVVGKWPVLPARLEQEGEPPLENRLILDSGSMSVVGLTSTVRSNHAIDIPVSAGIGGVGAGAVRAGRIRALSVGPWTFANPVVLFPPAGGGEDPDDLAKAVESTGIGVFGAPICRRFRLVFDYANELLTAEPAASLDAPFEFDMSGAILTSASLEFAAFRVVAVIDGSPAAEAGLRAGDTITAVDGRAAVELSLAGVREMFLWEGVRVTLRVQREANATDVVFVTRRLI